MGVVGSNPAAPILPVQVTPIKERPSPGALFFYGSDRDERPTGPSAHVEQIMHDSHTHLRPDRAIGQLPDQLRGDAMDSRERLHLVGFTLWGTIEAAAIPDLCSISFVMAGDLAQVSEAILMNLAEDNGQTLVELV